MAHPLTVDSIEELFLEVDDIYYLGDGEDTETDDDVRENHPQDLESDDEPEPSQDPFMGLTEVEIDEWDDEVTVVSAMEESLREIVQEVFASNKCKCWGVRCIDQIGFDTFLNRRAEINLLTKDQKEAFIMGQLHAFDGGEETVGNDSERKRTKNYTFYKFNHNISMCEPMWRQMIGVGKNEVTRIKQHMKQQLAVRVHGNIGKKPKLQGKITVDAELVREIRDFILNYAEANGEPSPGRHVATDGTAAKIYLPAAETYRIVYRLYTKSVTEKDKERVVCSERTFVRIWHQYAPWVTFREPRSDLCATCQELTEKLRKRLTPARRDKVIEQFTEHKRRFEMERQHYKDTIECARTTAGQSDGGATAHFCVDWAQATTYPHLDQQIGPLYFLSPPRVEHYGFANTALKHQLNFLIKEGEMPADGKAGKGANTSISLLYAGLLEENRGEKHIVISMDNCGGQNKNNLTLWFCAWLVMTGRYESVRLHFMIAGHTKFMPDGFFGVYKQNYRRSRIMNFEQLTRVLESSTPDTNKNKARTFRDGEGWKWLNWREFFEPIFRKAPRLKLFHHFLFRSDAPGMVTCKEFVDSQEETFSLLKDPTFKFDVAKMPAEINVRGLTDDRKRYLSREVRKYVDPEFQDEVCPLFDEMM
jgi:hypothetical protein